MALVGFREQKDGVRTEARQGETIEQEMHERFMTEKHRISEHLEELVWID